MSEKTQDINYRGFRFTVTKSKPHTVRAEKIGQPKVWFEETPTKANNTQDAMLLAFDSLRDQIDAHYEGLSSIVLL